VEILLNLAQVVALLSVAALCLYLIVTLVRLKDVIVNVQKDFSDLTANAKPVLENLAVVTEKMKSISTKVDDQVNLMKGSLESLKQAADNIVVFERTILQQLEEPILKITSTFGGLVSRFASLFNRFTREKTS
jgi:uncharacterized protein YoxC